MLCNLYYSQLVRKISDRSAKLTVQKNQNIMDVNLTFDQKYSTMNRKALVKYSRRVVLY